MNQAWAWLAWMPLVAWGYLLCCRGGFWRADQRLFGAGARSLWPGVAVVMPARDEAQTIGRAVASILDQDYPGPLALIVVDDQSRDESAALAREAARGRDAGGRLTVITGSPPPRGWTGKLWALSQGVAAVSELDFAPEFLLFSDADVAHHPGCLRELVDKAERESLALVSLMVKLHCQSPWERLLIPAFVFFFQKLYPFAEVNRPGTRTAAAAGGCMLVRRQALEDAGGLAPIRDALIDDCALARRLKAGGAIWLGLADASVSLRPYRGLGDIWRMVARSAFHQLGYSWPLLAGTVVGMALLYLAPPLLVVGGVIWGEFSPALAGALAWAAMAFAYVPTLAYYGRPWPAALELPLAGLLYTLMTIDSARRHVIGAGGAWKGRRYRPGSGGRE